MALTSIRDYGILPVVVLDRPDDADPFAEALLDGGLPIAEITLRTPAGLGAIRKMADRGDILVGAGTVLSPRQVDQAVDAGASFVVSPGFSPAVVRRCLDRGLAAIPGAVTATEMQGVQEMGITCVKFFPAQTSGGPAAIEALSAPFSGLSVIPTGGVDPCNAASYLTLGSVLAVGGSWMVPRSAILDRDAARISRLCRESVQLVRAIRADATPAIGPIRTTGAVT